MTLRIREATAGDAAVVIALWQEADLIRPWNDPQADYRNALDWPGSTVLLAEHGEQPVGTAMVGFDGHRGWIYYLAVANEARGQGVARELLGACDAWLRERGCPKVELMVREGNPASEFYERLGWETQNVRVYGRWLDGRDG